LPVAPFNIERAENTNF